MIHIHHYCASTGITTQTQTLPTLADGDVAWIDLESPTPEEEEQIFALRSVHPLTMEDMERPRRLPEEGAHLPKVEEFDDHLFVIVNPLPWHICSPTDYVPYPQRNWKWRPQLSTILSHQLLVTHHYDKLICIDAVQQSMEKRGDLLHRGPDFLFHLLLDEMVDEYAPVVERFTSQLERLETRLMSKPSRKLLHQLLHLKRRILFLRKTLVLEREVLARLVRAEFDLVSESEIHYYRNVYDHLVRYTELIEGAREATSDLMQMQLASASNRTNEVMKVLAMISTVVLPMTLVAGVYGMNFKHMPALEWQYGYYLSLGLMAILGLASFVLFKWKRWL